MANTIKYNATQRSIDQSVMDWQQVAEAKTISGGSITWTGSAATVDTQGGAASDDLDTIVATDVQVGMVIFLNIASAARSVRLRHEVGNLWLGGSNLTLRDIHHRVILFWDGAYWCLLTGGGRAATVTEVIPDSGENTLCVVAGRLAQYVDYIITQAAEARAGGLIAVTAAVTAAIQLAQPDANQDLINALANAIVAEYADDTEVYSAFTTTVFDHFQCGAYCAASSGSGTSEFSESDIPIILAYLGYYTGVPYDLIADIVEIIGADGLTRAVGLSVLEATTLDCDGSGGCACEVSFEWESSVSNTKKGCTVLVDVVLSMGGGALPIDIDVDITFSGTATGGGSDYTAVDTFVTFPAGSVDGDVQTVEVTITSGIGVGETIILGLDPDSGEVGAVATHTVTAIAGDCTDPWIEWFYFGTTIPPRQGDAGWTITNGVLRTTDVGDESPTNYTIDMNRTVEIGHSTEVNAFGFSMYTTGSPITRRLYHDTTYTDVTCLSNFADLCDNVSLSYTKLSLYLRILCQVNAPCYIDKAFLSGTGINPFTGT